MYFDLQCNIKKEADDYTVKAFWKDEDVELEYEETGDNLEHLIENVYTSLYTDYMYLMQDPDNFDEDFEDDEDDVEEYIGILEEMIDDLKNENNVLNAENQALRRKFLRREKSPFGYAFSW